MQMDILFRKVIRPERFNHAKSLTILLAFTFESSKQKPDIHPLTVRAFQISQLADRA